MKDKVVLITGTNNPQGIGAATALAFARDVSSRIFYMEEGIVYEDGAAKELFANPQKPKNRAFLHRIEMLNLDLIKDDFDLYNFLSRVTVFAEKQLLEAKQIKTLHLVLEEFITNIIFPQIDKIELEIGISKETKVIEIRAVWKEANVNPLESDSESGELARMILKKGLKSSEFSRTGTDTSQLLLTM